MRLLTVPIQYSALQQSNRPIIIFSTKTRLEITYNKMFHQFSTDNPIAAHEDVLSARIFIQIKFVSHMNGGSSVPRFASSPSPLAGSVPDEQLS